MALDKEVKHRLAVALASLEAAEAVASAISQGATGPADTVTALGAQSAFAAAATAGGATPTATNVNTAIDALAGLVHTRLGLIESKVNAILASMKAADLMS
jgi:hypothetical protein